DGEQQGSHFPWRHPKPASQPYPGNPGRTPTWRDRGKAREFASLGRSISRVGNFLLKARRSPPRQSGEFFHLARLLVENQWYGSPDTGPREELYFLVLPPFAFQWPDH